jgi:hypothetical protein
MQRMKGRRPLDVDVRVNQTSARLDVSHIGSCDPRTPARRGSRRSAQCSALPRRP